MSNHLVLASLYGGLVGYDAVSWYTYAVQTGTDSTQTADYHRAPSRPATIQATNGPPTSTGPIAGTQKNAAPKNTTTLKIEKKT